MPPEFPIGAAGCGSKALSVVDGAIIAIAFVLASVAALSSLPQAASRQVAPLAVVFPPWVSTADAIARSISAGHLVLRSGRLPSIVIVAPETDATATMAKPTGAWMLLALAGLAGCLDPLATPEPSA